MAQTYSKRELFVIKGRKEGLTQTEIAKKLGVTRQRVQQMERRLNLGFRRPPGLYKEYVFICGECKKPTKSKITGRKFCSRACFIKSKRVILTKEEIERRKEIKRAKNRIRSRHYYHNVLKTS